MPRSNNDNNESLDFDTIHHITTNPPSEAPWDALHFDTQPFHITGQDGRVPHPSESLSFSTVHDSLRVGRGAPFGFPREREKELSWTFKDILAQGPDDSRRSSVQFTPISPRTTTPKGGSRHFEWARRMSGASSSKSNAQTSEDDKSTKSHSQTRSGRIHSINNAFARLHTLPHVDFAQSKSATHSEHSMTLRQGLRSHPKAMLWSLMLSCTLIMEGFDLSLINGFYAFPPFRKKYGHLQPNGNTICTAGKLLFLMTAVPRYSRDIYPMATIINQWSCSRRDFRTSD